MARSYEDKLKAHMALGMTYEEAVQAIKDDEIIDKGGRCDWEPSVEEERAIRKATKLKVDRKPRNQTTRVKKPDDVKREIIDVLAKALGEKWGDIYTVSNIEKTIDLKIGEETFSIDLKKHRKAKEAE